MTSTHISDVYIARRVFDWHKAAKLLRGVDSATAGLLGDLSWTGGVILAGGQPVMTPGTYLVSRVSIPILVIEGKTIPCWCHNNDWDADTVWPASALAIYNSPT